MNKISSSTISVVDLDVKGSCRVIGVGKGETLVRLVLRIDNTKFGCYFITIGYSLLEFHLDFSPRNSTLQYLEPIQPTNRRIVIQIESSSAEGGIRIH